MKPKACWGTKGLLAGSEGSTPCPIGWSSMRVLETCRVARARYQIGTKPHEVGPAFY